MRWRSTSTASPRGTQPIGTTALITEFGGLVATGSTALLNPPLPERVKKMEVTEQGIVFNKKITLPYEPFIGTLGVSPEIEAGPRSSPTTGAATWILPDVAPGAVVYFPVHHKDAYLYLGDCHATQGDGELCVAVEMPSTTTVQVDLIKGWTIAWPRLENERFIMTIGSTRPMEDAARIAYRELIRWLVADYGFDEVEAYFLLTQAAGPARQHGRPQVHAGSVAVEELPDMSDTKSREEAVVRVACVQMEPVVGHKQANVEKSLGLIGEAASNGARLIVLPELANSGYVFESREEAFASPRSCPRARPPRPDPDRPGAQSLHRCRHLRARGRHALQLVRARSARACRHLPQGAFVERGEPLRARQSRLPGLAHADRADCGHDLLRRLVPRRPACALQGADIICISTNWVPIPGQNEKREAMANILCMGAAHQNSVFIAAADRIGTERGQPFIGQSLIVSYTGWPVAGPASPDKEEILYADCNLADARRNGTGTSTTRSCATGAPTFTTRCWARVEARVVLRSRTGRRGETPMIKVTHCKDGITRRGAFARWRPGLLLSP